MTLIDIAAALSEGALPTNAQAHRALQVLLSTSLLETQLLSPSGATLIADVRHLVELTDRIVLERNGGEEAQEFWWKSRGVVRAAGAAGITAAVGEEAERKLQEKLAKKEQGTAPNKKQKAASLSRSTAKAAQVVTRDGNQAFKHLRTLARLLLVQPELRHILSDGGLLLAEVLDKTAGSTLDDARGTMGQVKSATGTFQNVAARALAAAKAARQDVPQGIEAVQGGKEALRQLGEGATKGMPALDALRTQLKLTAKSGLPSKEVIEAELANKDAVPRLKDLQAQIHAASAEIATSPAQLERLKGEAMNGGIPDELRTALLGKPGEAGAIDPTDLVDAVQMLAVANPSLHLTETAKLKEVVGQAAKDAKKNAEDAWTDERRAKLIRRLRKLAVDCQSNAEYKDALEWFITRTETLVQTTQRNLEKPSTSLDGALDEAVVPLLRLLENFAGGRQLRPILELARSLSLGAKDNPELLAIWRDADALLRRSLLEEGYAMEPACEQAWRDMLKRFEAMDAAYRQSVARLVADATAFMQALAQDPLLKELSRTLKALLKDVSIGREGNMLPSRALWQDLRMTILPAVFARVGVLPVPRIKYTHPDFDLVVENIAIELKNLLPKMVGFHMSNDVEWDFEKTKSSSHCHSVKIKIKGMSLRVHKLAFALKLKKGLPFKDRGIADLLVGDFGVSIRLDVPKDPGPHYFIVKKVKAKLGTLQVKVHKSNHRIMHHIAGALANSYLTKRILRHLIAMGVTIGLKQLDVALMASRLERQEDQGDISLQEMRKKMAELRDLLRKYNEMAGTLELDFTREEDPQNEKGWEDAHAVKWVKGQVLETGKRPVVRHEWRSTAFDKIGEETVQAPPTPPPEDAEQVEETPQEAAYRGKPDGPTTLATVEQAEADLQQVEAQRAQEATQAMESEAGAQAMRRDSSTSDQVERLERAVDRHEA